MRDAARRRITRGIAFIASMAVIALAGCSDTGSRNAVAPADPVSIARGGPTGVQRVTVAPSAVSRDPGQTA